MGHGRSGLDPEELRQSGDLEDPSNRVLEVPEDERGLGKLAGSFERAHQHAEAGRVDESQVGEVEDDLTRVLVENLAEAGPDLRELGDVELAPDADRPVPVAVVSGREVGGRRWWVVVGAERVSWGHRVTRMWRRTTVPQGGDRTWTRSKGGFFIHR